jgi:hypothetical protein
LRIGQALISDLSDIPDGIGTAGQVLVVNSDRTAYEFATRLQASDLAGYVQQVNGLDPDGSGNVEITTEDINEAAPNLYYTDARFDTRYATKTHYHNRYSTQAETERSGATATLEIYYTARPDGDGYAESEVSDVGETDTINRRLYYSTKFQADPDTAGDWTEYTTQPANNATFATAKAALLAGLNETDATAETRGTLPLSLKMVRTTTAASGDLLLDTYTGSAAAFSVRKLDKDYVGYCMKVRRASDDAEADIGFDSNDDLDTAAIATHCGASAGFVSVWYDQANIGGTPNNATQSTSSKQPQIYNGTAVITENGKPAIKPTSDTQELDFSLASSASGYTLFSVIKESGVASTPSSCLVNILGAGVGGDYILIGTQNSTTTIISQDAGNLSYRLDESTWTPANRGDVYTAVATGNHLVSVYTDYTGSNFGRFGYVFGTIAMYQMQEAIFYPSNEFTSGNLSGIETNISTHFSTP